jgi:hypothetical protein
LGKEVRRRRIKKLPKHGKRPIVALSEATARRKKFNAAQKWAHKRYGKAFQKLAE